MTLTAFAAGVNTSFSTQLNTNFNTLNYKRPNIMTMSGSVSTSTYGTLSSKSIASSLYCTSALITLGIEIDANAGASYYKITATYSDLSTSTFVAETGTGSSGTNGQSVTLLHTHTAPAGKYITNFLIEGKVTTPGINIYLRDGALQRNDTNPFRTGLVSQILYWTEV